MKLPGPFIFGKTLIFGVLIGAAICAGQSTVFAETIDVKITLLSVTPARVRVDGRFLDTKSAPTNWSFLQQHADVRDISERIKDLEMYRAGGVPIEVRKLIAGEYLSSERPETWRYDVDLTAPAEITDAAHISWLTDKHGALMLLDLLPRFAEADAARVTIECPAGWQIATSEKLIGKNSYAVDEIGNAIFLIGSDVRENTRRIDNSILNLAVAGTWQFSDSEALEMASSITVEHRRLFGGIPNSKLRVMILPFPAQNVDADRWRAETRGSTVFIVSGAIPLRSVAIQRLHEQLRHEIFHLWLPNALNLSGNYDWFYEGFSIYCALRSGVELNQIRFDDYLSTLSRGYDLADWVSSEHPVPLFHASANRWLVPNNFVNSKGLIVAFLSDIAILRETHGKQGVRDVIRALYDKHRKPNRIEDGSTAVINVLKGYPILEPILANYILGESKLNWQNDLESAGLDFDGRKLSVKPKLTGKQKDLLDKLGYNQWRKLLGKKT